MRLHLGAAASPLAEAAERVRASGLADRVRSGDPAAYGAHAEEAGRWLGWLRAPAEMREHVGGIERMVRERAPGLSHALVLGMGGSSLCPEVARQSFGRGAGVELRVLDSTDPAAVRAAGEGTEPGRTLHIVSSKSGTTTEPLAFMAHFWERAVAELGEEGAGRSFVAITDPGTPLAEEARARGFAAVHENPADIGGRYSALSLFGLVPMALLGLPLGVVLDRAQAVLASGDGPALGAALAHLAEGGRDKVTILADPAVASVGLWVEQLLAESLGKSGRGVVPVAEEPVGDPEVYGDDRVFVHHRMTGQLDADAAALAAAGHPVITIELTDTLDLAGVFMLWEIATATVGALMGINPFDQPDVQAAKDATNRVLAQLSAGEGPEDRREQPGAVAGAVGDARRGDYLALLAFCAPSPAADRALARLRVAARARTGVATTSGYGPRFLHSTGQLHKGGPASGIFVQFVSDDATDLDVPGRGYSFGELKRAQALGDAQALAAGGRRLVRVGLGTDPAAALDSAADAAAGA